MHAIMFTVHLFIIEKLGSSLNINEQSRHLKTYSIAKVWIKKQPL